VSKQKESKLNKFKIIVTLLFLVVGFIFITNSTKILKNPINIFILEKGSITYEEATEGYIIREEEVLQGENYENGIVQIVSEGERVAKGESTFRYYSENEESLVNQMAELDTQINEAIEESGLEILPSSETISLEKQIESNIDSICGLNELQKIQEYKSKIESYISKKAQISAETSPNGSKVKALMEQRTVLENELNSSSEIVKSPIAGLVSYRVDGLEDVLKSDDFSYLNSDLLKSFELKVGAVIPQSSEKGKIINNYHCYIATYINTEKASSAKVGDNVTLRLSNLDEVSATITYISSESEGKILVFEIKKDVEKLIENRKISFDIIWWNFTGFKVSNDAIITEDDKTYVERSKAGYTEKILVKINRQNDTYSILSNYTESELLEMGYTEEEIKNMSVLKLYDQILLQK
jgi:uncharacterized protein YeeX (DUF496 family)